jgi:hypothetical protein
MPHKLMLTALPVLASVSSLLGLPLLGPFFDILDVLFYCSMLAILWLERLTIPRFLKGIVSQIASASLFIYIVNWPVINQSNLIMPSFGVQPWWPLQTLAAVVLGVIANKVWDELLRVLGRWFQVKARSPQVY